MAYERLHDNQDRIHCSFVMGKACLALIKAVTIPCLELTAATISVSLGELLKKELDVKPNTIQYHTDSFTVLRYSANKQKRFQVYVTNRVQVVRNLSNPNQWRYVDMNDNPTDDASRGLTTKTLTEQQLLLQGPEFQWKVEDWLSQPTSFGEVTNEDPEVKKLANACLTTVGASSSASSVTKLLQYFSDWY